MGWQSESIKKKMLSKENLTFVTACSTALSFELAEQQSKMLTQESINVNQIKSFRMVFKNKDRQPSKLQFEKISLREETHGVVRKKLLNQSYSKSWWSNNDIKSLSGEQRFNPYRRCRRSDAEKFVPAVN